MKLRTEITIAPWQEPMDYSHNILCLGSCFADNIARILKLNKFNVVASPTGILFNPMSIASALERITTMQGVEPHELIACDGSYVAYDFHSSISGESHTQAVEVMNEALNRGNKALSMADMAIVTLGTAWVYRLKESGKVVANCHKQPAALFSRQLLSTEECIEALERIVALCPKRIVFTLSPVRHIGEGMEDNSLSKAILRVAIEEVCRRHKERVVYFPSYEIMMDDLRDYRFYADDLVHPTPMAISYIAEKFFATALSPSATTTKAKVEEIVRAAHHRPKNPKSEAYKAFCTSQLRAIEQLKSVDLSEEKRFFEHMLQINL
jgi:hypothetical protein